MTRITKATLAAQLEAAHVSYEKLAAECAALRAENQALRKERDEWKQMFETEALRNTDAAPKPAAARPLSDFRARCQAARELAMRSGRCVRVS